MEKKLQYTKKNLKNIKALIQEETGVAFSDGRGRMYGGIKMAGLAAACLLCMLMTAAFTYYKLSALKGDELAFSSAYQGGGRFDIVITNLSDHPLELERKVKVMQWSTGEAVPGDAGKIAMKGEKVAPHSTEIIQIDLSKGYDIAGMKDGLEEGDWYYLVLTNNQFLFGQDWMCSIDFQEKDTDEVARQQQEFIARKAEREAEANQAEMTSGQKEAWEANQAEMTSGQKDAWEANQTETATGRKGALDSETLQDEKMEQSGEGNIGSSSNVMIYEEWAQPLDVIKVSGRYSDHVTLAGNEGDAVYAVADGKVSEIDFNVTEGNYLVLKTEDGILVKYGHLKEVMVKEGDSIKRTDKIAMMGKTGMTTGPCLSLSVSRNGEYMSPIVEENASKKY